MASNPSKFKHPLRPVERVAWEQVMAFIAALNRHHPGLELCLPSEAQWEYACRAGTRTAIYTGALEILGDRKAPALDAIAWYGGNSGEGFELDNGVDSSGWPEKQTSYSRAGTHPVVLKAANGWGFYDMLGNVWEWVEDRWHDDYPGAPSDGSAWLADGDRERFVCGACWGYDARGLRTAYRYGSQPDEHSLYLGFRCGRVQGDAV